MTTTEIRADDLRLPALPEPGRAGGGRRRRRWDVVAVLTAYLVVIMAIPANLIVGPLGGAGPPSALFRLVLLLWWCAAWLMVDSGLAKGRQPLRIGTWIFGASVFTGYLAAATRPLSEIEANGADRTLLFMLGLMGLTLITADGIRDRGRFDVLVKRMTIGGGLIALVGIVQFFVGFDITQYIHPPGLVSNEELPHFFEGHVRRVAGTGSHPIEFGVTLAMLIPLAIHYGHFSRRGRRFRGWLPAVLMGVAMPMALSRSAVVGIVAGGIFMMTGWKWDRVKRALIFLPFFLVAVRAAVPGVLGTLKAQFLNAGSDPSISGRTDDYAFVGVFIRARPWFGRGLGTFNPIQYRLLDNQYMGTTIETGVFGLLCVLGLLLIGIFSARGARRISVDERSRDLAQSLAASVVVALTSLATFDAFSFPLFVGMLFLVLGCCGAMWRLERERVGLAPPPPVAELGIGPEQGAEPVAAGVAATPSDTPPEPARAPADPGI